LIKNYYLPILRPLRTSKLQKKPLGIKREHPALQNMNFVLHLWVIFALLDPDPIRIRTLNKAFSLMQRPLVYRSVISILFVFLTRAAGKPVFYTSACVLLSVDRAELDTQSLHNNKKRLAVELSYKVRWKTG
jgi:hypothetical protein